MAQDINLRRLVIKSFHIDTVEWGDHNDVTADGKMTVSHELLDELMEENKDIIEKIDIQIIKPGDHDRWTNTIMDIIPVSTKVLGILGVGLAFLAEWGIYELLTGKLVSGLAGSFISVVPFSSMAMNIFIVYMATGVMVGAFGGVNAIRNYLKV